MRGFVAPLLAPLGALLLSVAGALPPRPQRAPGALRRCEDDAGIPRRAWWRSAGREEAREAREARDAASTRSSRPREVDLLLPGPRVGAVRRESDQHRHFQECSTERQNAVPGCDSGRIVTEGCPLYSSASEDPWSHSLFSLIHSFAGAGRTRSRRSSVVQQSSVEAGQEFPRVTVHLQVNNTGSPGAHLTQLSIRDKVLGLTLLENCGKVVESGFLTFTLDSLPAGSLYAVKYTAIVQGRGDATLELPAYLTFTNASQNDVNLFGPLVSSLTLKINSTEKIYPNHGVHFAGFMAAFVPVLSLGLLLFRKMGTADGRNPLQQRKSRNVANGDADPEYAVCDIGEMAKEEAAFEDKMVDIMVLEDPQNMHQALDNLDMSNLLRAAASLESVRVQIHKDLVAALLRGPRLHGLLSVQAERRLLGVLHGQLMGMEGKLKEEHVARVTTLAARCNLETREEMEAEHRREAAQKAKAERLFQQASQQAVLECSVLLDKLHKLDQNRLQRDLLARHEEASAQVQRRVVVQRRAELHKIFAEELEEAVRMGEMERAVASGLLHAYFTCQDQLEEVLDAFLGSQRSVLAERHAQRQFLVHSLQSLKGLMLDVFSKTSARMDSWFQELRREAGAEEDQVEPVLDKAQKELLLARQGLEEALTRERNAMHSHLVKRRRSLIANKLQEHKQQQKELSAVARAWDGGAHLGSYLQRWRGLLISQCLELGELINNLDEEAAADIRKVTMRVIHGAVAEVKAILPAAAAALLGPVASRFLPQREPVGGALAEAQERLHREGKAAQHTLRATRDGLQRLLEQELYEQQTLRGRARDFFGSLCTSQLTLSEEELLRLKLAFQSCLSRMDRCLVLPRAQSRCRLQAALSQWRKEQLEREQNVEKRPPPGGGPADGTAEPDPDPSPILAFRTQVEAQIRLYEQEKETESTAAKKVLEELRLEREEELQAQEESLAVQAAALHFHRAEKWARALETHGALLSLQALLVDELCCNGMLGAPGLAQIIHGHCQGLESAELLLQREREEWETLVRGHAGSGAPAASDYDGNKGKEVEEDAMFHVDQDCRITGALQGALRKCEQVTRVIAKRLRDEDERSQVMEDLREQLELKGLYTHLDQELEFAAALAKQSQASAGTIGETLRLLLPTSSEADVLSLVDTLCPRQAAAAADGDKGWGDGTRVSLVAKLREDIVRSNVVTSSARAEEKERALKKRRSLLEKLFPVSETSRKRRSVLEGEGHVQEAARPAAARLDPLLGCGPWESSEQGAGQEREPAAPWDRSAEARGALHPGEKVFIFRSRMEPSTASDGEQARRRRKKKNFLNFKRAAVVPQQ
uniref:EvC ciliary complex subunit 2 n=1 Tax=Scleropages formosus TaxID=113540 RepID=A0A8C9R9X9_SCLFO